MKVLYTAFNGKNNSSKILLDAITAADKLYLKNSFNTSVTQLIDKIKNNNYDLVVSLGQAPIEKDTIKIGEEEILCYKNKVTKNILIALKDDKGEIKTQEIAIK